MKKLLLLIFEIYVHAANKKIIIMKGVFVTNKL